MEDGTSSPKSDWSMEAHDERSTQGNSYFEKDKDQEAIRVKEKNVSGEDKIIRSLSLHIKYLKRVLEKQVHEKEVLQKQVKDCKTEIMRYKKEIIDLKTERDSHIRLLDELSRTQRATIKAGTRKRKYSTQYRH